MARIYDPDSSYDPTTSHSKSVPRLLKVLHPDVVANDDTLTPRMFKSLRGEPECPTNGIIEHESFSRTVTTEELCTTRRRPSYILTLFKHFEHAFSCSPATLSQTHTPPSRCTPANSQECSPPPREDDDWPLFSRGDFEKAERNVIPMHSIPLPYFDDNHVFHFVSPCGIIASLPEEKLKALEVSSRKGCGH